MSRRARIGFDRKLELEWLDLSAAKAAAGASTEEVKEYLLSALDALAYSGEAPGSARAKTVRVLLRIWGGVGPELKPLHDRAIKLLPTIPPDQRLALHWAMTIAAYPFFADHAAVFGRLFPLQEMVSTAQIKRRIAEQWGDRSTVMRTSRHVVRTMVAWGVIEDAGKGSYVQAGSPRPVAPEVTQLLLEAVLLDSDQEALPLAKASKHPALFPFEVRLDVQQLRRSDHVRVYRQGLDTDFVMLAG